MATTFRSTLLDDEPPPEYSQFPLPEEQSIDAGAGAPIVRAQPPHLVVNPSDPRSQYARRFFHNGHAPPELPRRAEVSSGPMPMNPRLPQRLNVGYEQLETTPTQSELLQAPWPANIGSGPGMLHTRRSDSGLSHLYAPTVATPARTPPGPVSANISYSSLRDNPTSIRVVNNTPGRCGGTPVYPGAQWQPRQYNNSMLSSWPHYDATSGSYGQPSGATQPVAYTVVCPVCRNTGKQSNGLACHCPVGSVAQQNRLRPQAPSLIGLLDNMLTPLLNLQHNLSSSAPVAYGSSHYTPNDNGTHYLAYVPGTGNPCPSCAGRSYFRNHEAQGTSIAVDMARRFGGELPHCNVCGDRGRVG
ncbi:hypothetical protein GGI21_002227 [Coemansia aciculifera]|uniref:Uncharacterized protein n=1 Tax=Coemansia aciculifera TaxID=417176 RepID=A0ACC1M1R8_9FUNG|nr:hypothetical protein IWW38_003269 [Coemansia aciculifera]KAJ2909094.1 hypothetical protein GGI21_002227 [Coemansia aciculifera]